MIKILFVCLGNICRSPMAEFVFRDMVEKRGLADRFYIASAGTSDEERGNPVHRGTREKLRQEGVPLRNHRATQMKRGDYGKYDYLIGMEERNLSGMRRIVGGDPEKKIYRLLDFSDRPRDIADPWYTGNFDLTYEDICEGCRCLLDYMIKEQGLFYKN